MRPPNMQPYITRAAAIVGHHDPKPILVGIKTTLGRRHVWRVVSALKWGC